MAQLLYQFWKDDQGQDLIEYSLLITFIAIACAAIVGAGRPATNAIWQSSNNTITNAATFANGG
ncbi:MAG TPA: hypothetical protein VLY04_00140 [Bryobacteraceae bacterium]|nr:hypothetical protein [Bryobacteraceae bacterium]